MTQDFLRAISEKFDLIKANDLLPRNEDISNFGDAFVFTGVIVVSKANPQSYLYFYR